MSSYGTRRSSALAESSSQSSSKPISIGNNTNTTLLGDSALFGSLSSSAGKHKRPTTMKQRRMSSTATAIAHSLPSNTTATTHYSVSASHSGLLSPVAGTSSGTSTRPRSTSSNNLMYHNNNNNLDDDDEGEIRPGRKIKGETYACEKCNKLYAHERCLVKHRWEHTAHWKEASKLLLSKHQQVQLLEAAAILKAAQSGTSLPEEKGFWPAAVSPPTSGLLGSPLLNIDMLTSRTAYRNSPSSISAAFDSPFTVTSELPEESELGDDDDEDDGEGDTGESVSTGDDALDDGMFDLDLGSAAAVGSTPSPAPAQAPTLVAHSPPSSSRHQSHSNYQGGHTHHMHARGSRSQGYDNTMDVDSAATTSGSSSDEGSRSNSNSRGRSVGHDSGFGSAPKAEQHSTAHHHLHHGHLQQQQQQQHMYGSQRQTQAQPASQLGAGLTAPALGYFDGDISGSSIALR